MKHNTEMFGKDAVERAQQMRQNARLIYATYHSDLLAAMDALDNGADPNACDADGVPVLVAALSLHDAEHNNLEFLITQLLQAGAHPDGGHDSPAEPTPLAYALELEDTYLLRCLLESGANVNAKDADGDTPLMRAAALGQAEALHILLAAGADATLRNNTGQTALELALAYEETACEQLLEGHLFANIHKYRPTAP